MQQVDKLKKNAASGPINKQQVDQSRGCHHFLRYIIDPILIPSLAVTLTPFYPNRSLTLHYNSPLHLTDKTLILFPINDNDDVSQAEGGSHWSLLAYYRNANLFVHHDSTRSLNKESVEQLYKAVVGYIGLFNTACEAKFLECPDSPKQVNGYDCGLYVTAIARVICSWRVNNENTEGNNLWFSVVKEQVTASFVSEMRREILALIKDMMARQ